MLLRLCPTLSKLKDLLFMGIILHYIYVRLAFASCTAVASKCTHGKPQCLLCGGLTDQSSGQVKWRDAVSVALGKIRKTSYDCPITFKVLRNTEEVVSSV